MVSFPQEPEKVDNTAIPKESKKKKIAKVPRNFDEKMLQLLTGTTKRNYRKILQEWK
jgi:hypothetical protein